ncbi:MAG: hypothetical protein Q8935_21380 [Bacillota bacterium]|nr:hypothetical protein [Bacillota bacterium]
MRKKVIFTLILVGLFGVAQAQKGDKSIAAGPLISFPIGSDGFPSILKTGGGLEAIGQYNFSNRSALLLKMNLTSWGYKERMSGYGPRRLTFLSLQGGYKYQFGSSGFFINGLAGTDIDLGDRFSTISFTLGAGKRFTVKDDRFIDVGVDLAGGDAEGRVNFKVIFSLIQWLKGK